MIADKRWKFMHAEGGLRPMLFDLERDPEEYIDLGASHEHQGVIDMMYERLAVWARRMSQRTAISDEEIDSMRGRSRRKGVLLGLYDGDEVDAELTAKYRGRVP